MSTNIHRAGTKRWYITEACNSGISTVQCFGRFRQAVLDQVDPWIFRANVGGTRVAKPMAEQLVDFKNEINRVYSMLDRLAGDAGIPEDYLRPDNVPVPVPDEIPSGDEPDNAPDEPDNQDDSPDENSDDETPDEPVKPQASAKKRKSDEKRFFVTEWRRIRAWIHARAETTGQPVDSLDSLRPVQDACKAIDVGIPARAMLFSMTMHWPAATRAEAGIEDFDFSTVSEQHFMPDGKRCHYMAGYVLKLMQAGIPVMLIGPAGTGKSRAASDAASLMGLPYGECPMTAGATPSWLLGRQTFDGFVASEFVERYSVSGGVFNFEEIDSADANMLIVLNNALANNALFNPVNGIKYDRHEKFVPVATANTFGLGANAQYAGREKLDLATIDRWRMGRVFMPLDESVADSIAGL